MEWMHCVWNYGCVRRPHPSERATARQRRVVLCMQCNLSPNCFAGWTFSTSHAALKPVSVPLSVAHIRCTLAWRICSELKPIVSDSESFWYQPDVPGDSQEMFIQDTFIHLQGLLTLLGHPHTVNVLSEEKNLDGSAAFCFPEIQNKANVDCKILWVY